MLKFTAAGFVGGLLSGALLDYLGFQRSPIRQWFVRTLSGEGESISEGVCVLRQRLRHATGSMTEAYGFSPTNQTYTALETIAANLCWLPPLVGWLREKNLSKASSGKDE